MSKKIISSILALILICVSFSGCGKEEAAETGNEKAFSYWLQMPTHSATSVSNIGDITMYKEMEKLTGVKVKFVHPPAGQGAEKFNLMMASKEYYDVIEYNWAKYQGGATKAIADGVAVKLNDIIEKHAPNFSKILKDNPAIAKAASTQDGSYYGFMRISETVGNIYQGLIIRKDWLDDLGIEPPETIDEWEEMLTRFKNEKGAIAPLTMRAGHFITASGSPNFTGAYGIGEGFYVDDDGKVQFGPAMDAYKDYLTTMNRWYANGLLDPEFATINGSAAQARVMDGKSGAFQGTIGGAVGSYLEAWKARGETENELIGVPHPVLKKGDLPEFYPTVSQVSSPHAVITSKAQNPEMIAEWLDYFYSKEGAMLGGFGIEGLTYTMDGDVPVYTELITNNPDGLSIYEAMGKHARSSGGRPGLSLKMPEEWLVYDYPYEAQRQTLKAWSEGAERGIAHQLPELEYSLEESDEAAALKLDITGYTEEMIMRFIHGEEPLDNFKEYQQNLKNLKLDRLLEIMQGAYDEYLAK